MLRAGAGGLWHLIAIGIVALAYLAWAFEIQGAFTFLVRGAVMTLVILTVLRLVTGALARLMGEGQAAAGGTATAIRYGWLGRYRPVIRRIVQAAIYVAAAALRADDRRMRPPKGCRNHHGGE